MNTTIGGDADRQTKPSREGEAEKAFSSPFLIPFIQAMLSGAVLLCVCNWHCIYEEDQMAKTAQVISLATNSNWRHFATTTDYYSKDLFSAYYFVATAFYKMSRLPPVEALNLFSVACGVIFFAVTPEFFRRVFKLPAWLTWFALMSAPILVLTFNYGNEAAFAIMLTSLAAFALTFDNMGARILAAVFYVAAAYSRSDYLLLWPALSFLTFVGNNGVVDWRKSLRKVLPFAVASAVLGIAYLALVLRKFPEPEFFNYQATLKLFAAYFVYAPNLVNVIFALVGFGICVARRRFRFLLLLPVFLQCLPYLTNLSSPKYILPSVVVIVIFAVLGMVPLLKRAPLILALALAVPWLVSFSPYGVFGPARSAFWYVPTDDGPLPAGGFLGFYARVKQGFYQRRYDQELEQVGEAMPQLERQAEGADIAGYFNVQALRLWAVRNQRWEMPPKNMPFWVADLGEAGDKRAKFMIKVSYLYSFKQSARLREQLAAAYNEGRVRGTAGSVADPFPDVIQCGSLVPQDSDHELGQRILFLNNYFQGNQLMRREEFVKDFSGVSWIPKDRFDREGPSSSKPLYADSKWVCLAENVPNAVYYSMRFPPAYTRSRQQLN